ncbi:DUF3822 family protein [Winogradskyella litorisediminis]|uniref:DUF3822 family protein n=1 Tax=Winogradskyella litorisediminis TaxID=1156618 RepID=A0ABW3N238_9FLAO
MTQKNIKELSIQVNLNGLSFSINNTVSKEDNFIHHLDFKEKLTPFETLNRLKEELASNTAFSENFKNVSVIHFNELATLVPKALYDEAHNAEYLKFNSKILKTDFIASDELKHQEAISVYVPYVNINNYLFDTFGSFKYKHASTVFLDAIDSFKTEEKSIFVNVEKNAMQVAFFQNNKIEFYNHFEFSSPEDFIYYLLFTCEQKQLNPDELKLTLTGSVEKDDDIYNIAYKYIRHVEILENSQHFLIKNTF